tara:strand:+ start:1662 stop:2084 length:423 start_codon:yes stop_codon:yes gene_type:complete
MLNLIIVLNNSDKHNISVKNNIRINDLITNLYNKMLKDNYTNKNNYIITLNYKGVNLVNRLNDYDINNNDEIHLNIKSKSQNIQHRKSIVDDYIISPFSSSLSNSLEKDYDNIDTNYILNKIKNIENELEELKEYINNIN